jgi:hypothetical protein
MLDIETFDNSRGGNVAYKALAHPVAADRLARLAALLNQRGPVAIYDPDGMAPTLLALSPHFNVEGVYVHDSRIAGHLRGKHLARPLTDLPSAPVNTVLIAGFDAARLTARITPLLPTGASALTLDCVKLPANWLTKADRYLDALNFATNFVFYRDDGHFGTRLTTVNYWSAYGAGSVKLFMRLYDMSGCVLADWEQDAPAGAGGIILDSADIRRRFGLPPFIGQLFLHAVGVAGHDIIKYALDTYSTDGGESLSCTHDSNAWPADNYAGLPAPLPRERVIVWLQNSHAQPIPAGAMSLRQMGTDAPAPIPETIPGFATVGLDVSQVLPDLRWPSQIELLARRYVVRPRYEITRGDRTRIAHMNVERNDLQADPGIKTLSSQMGRGFILPFPVLPSGAYRTTILPTPMSSGTADMPLRVDVFAPDGARIADHFLGLSPRGGCVPLDLDAVPGMAVLEEGGHAELVYDFRDGGDADGWLHAVFRYESRTTGHIAESSFGAHIFNTIMTYKNEPQSYSGPPPGLTTKLFLRLGVGTLESFCVLIYPASAPWHPYSATKLELYGSAGKLLASKAVQIACSGSLSFRVSQHFEQDALRCAGEGGYVLIKDATCRLFGFHGLDDRAGKFSLDHMFGF